VSNGTTTTGLGAIIAIKDEGSGCIALIVTAGWGPSPQTFKVSLDPSTVDAAHLKDAQVLFTPADGSYTLLGVIHDCKLQSLPFFDLALQDQKMYIMLTPKAETKVRLTKSQQAQDGLNWVIESAPATTERGAAIFTFGQIFVGILGTGGVVIPNWKIMADLYGDKDAMAAAQTFTFVCHEPPEVESAPAKALETLVEHAKAGFESHEDLLQVVKGGISLFKGFTLFTKVSPQPFLDHMLEASLFFYSSNRPKLVPPNTPLAFGLSSASPHPHALRIDDGKPWDTLGQYLDAMQQRDLLLYTHGFKTDFTTLLTTGLTLREKIKPGVAVLVFAWPSEGSFFDYMEDEKEAEKSIPAFSKFLKEANEFQKSRNGCLDILIHSLGNKIFLNACADLATAGLTFRKVVLCAADIPVKEAPALLQNLVPAMTKDLTLVVNKNDWALRTSETVFHPEQGLRLGQDEAYPESPGIKVIPIGPEGGIIGHSYDTSDKVDSMF